MSELDQDELVSTTGYGTHENPAEIVTDTTKSAQAPVGAGVLPIVLGLLLIVASLYFPFQNSFNWAFLPGTWSGATNLMLIVIGVGLGLLLLVYPFRLRSALSDSAKTPRYVATFVVPVLLWLAGMTALATLFSGMSSMYPGAPQPQSCVALYSDMAAVKKENPAFRLSPTDPDEIRCGINRALYG